MLFSSVEFLYLFLPACLLCYFLSPKKLRNGILLIFSLVFYAVGEPIYLFLMLGVIIADYTFGICISRFGNTQKRAKFLLWTAVIFNLGILFFFKYFAFFANTALALAGSESSVYLALPIGISFYVFQALSYIIDVYGKKVEPQKSLVAFGAYVTLFPQLIAGPIVRYSDIENELKSRRETLLGIAHGISRFAVGLAKKTVFANSAGQMWEVLREINSASPSPAGAFLALVFFAFQIYFDFSGYSDMAIGLGRIFGFEFPENFDYPYISRSITEFWRRWHITLSSWFREYVYFPLGGSRRGRFRTYVNLFAVWAFTGLWHGASWNFLLWGLYFFVLLVIEKAFLLKRLEKLPKVFSHAYALVFILVGWLIFAFDGSAEGLALSDGVKMLGNLVGIGCEGFIADGVPYELSRNLLFLAVMAVGATPLPKKLALRLSRKKSALFALCRPAFAIALILLSTAYSVSADYDPFLYFRF